MSRLRIYFDEDAVQHALLAALRLRGVETTSALEEGLIGVPDLAQLGWCHDHRWALYTFNVGDFCALHRDRLKSGLGHGGIIVAPQQRYPVGEQMRRILRITADHSAESMRDRLEFLSSWGG